MRDAARAAQPMAPVENRRGRSIAVERLALTDFRNHASLTLELSPRPVVLLGSNGAGKTNLLEAVSLLAAGQGLRRAPFADLARTDGAGGWAVAARVQGRRGPLDIGTGMLTGDAADVRARRLVKIDGTLRGGSGALADHVEMVWVTPAMDGLFAGAASERRQFLDRLIQCFDPGYRARANAYDRAMRSRNRLLADGIRDPAQFSGLEIVMAEAGAAIAAARSDAVAALQEAIDARRARDPASPFPWSRVSLDGALEADLALRSAIEVEDAYARLLRETRERDRLAGRALDGPHRTDFVVRHGPKDMPARLCSTGEQKALLLGLVLAHADLIAERRNGRAPILLLDEVAAHLDGARREALFAEIVQLGAQAWMSGTDERAFSALLPDADVWRVEAGGAARMA